MFNRYIRRFVVGFIVLTCAACATSAVTRKKRQNTSDAGHRGNVLERANVLVDEALTRRSHKKAAAKYGVIAPYSIASASARIRGVYRSLRVRFASKVNNWALANGYDEEFKRYALSKRIAAGDDQQIRGLDSSANRDRFSRNLGDIAASSDAIQRARGDYRQS